MLIWCDSDSQNSPRNSASKDHLESHSWKHVSIFFWGALSLSLHLGGGSSWISSEWFFVESTALEPSCRKLDEE